MAAYTLVGGIIGVVIVFILFKVLSGSDNARGSLPPGPKGLPLVGNINDLPKPGAMEAQHWQKLKPLYGPISSINVMGQTLVIINDVKLALELMEKRSAKFSSRPSQVMAGEMVGWENSLGLSPYGNRFRTYRKNMSRIIGSKASAAQFNKMQEAEVGHFLLHVLDSPEDLIEHIKKEAGALILKIAYGYTAEPHKADPLVDMAVEAMENLGVAAIPGAFMVDIFPFLRYFPNWLPGTGWKKTANDWAAQLAETNDRPYSFVKSQMARGEHVPSFLSQLLEAGDADPEVKHTNKWSALSLYTAGADTTVSSIAFFFLAMTKYPEVQRRAQEEIDRVVGSKRLPELQDRENLPYVEAIVKEVLRWGTVAPMGLPHTSTEDDVIDGYLIPKGAMLMANIWYFLHDEDVYPDPDTFKPERFLEIDGNVPEQDPHIAAFGFGRRVCPGKQLADNALFLNIAQSLAVFQMSKVVENGKVIEPIYKMEPGLISKPAPFRTNIKPRSSEHEGLIRAIEKVYPWQESDGEKLKALA